MFKNPLSRIPYQLLSWIWFVLWSIAIPIVIFLIWFTYDSPHTTQLEHYSINTIFFLTPIVFLLRGVLWIRPKTPERYSLFCSLSYTALLCLVITSSYELHSQVWLYFYILFPLSLLRYILFWVWNDKHYIILFLIATTAISGLIVYTNTVHTVNHIITAQQRWEKCLSNIRFESDKNNVYIEYYSWKRDTYTNYLWMIELRWNEVYQYRCDSNYDLLFRQIDRNWNYIDDGYASNKLWIIDNNDIILDDQGEATKYLLIKPTGIYLNISWVNLYSWYSIK